MHFQAVVLCRAAIVGTLDSALAVEPRLWLALQWLPQHQQQCQPGHVDCPHDLPFDFACILRLQYVAGVSSLWIAGTTLYVAPLAMAGAVVAAAVITYVAVRSAVKLAWMAIGWSSGANLPVTTNQLSRVVILAYPHL